MVRMNLEHDDRYAMIGIAMFVVGLMFLFYMCSSLLGTTRKYRITQTELVIKQ